MANLREEQLRSNRRLTRQFIGAVALLLALIGLLTVLSWCVSAVRGLLDDSGRREEYADRLYGLVMLDAAPFEELSAADPSMFKQAAIWGTVYQAQKNGGNLDIYERDPDTGSAMIPKLEIDTYIANLLGPGYEIPEGSFEYGEFIYMYNEEKQAYLVPVTSAVALYTPQVEKIWRQDGKAYVTVGYVPTASNNPTGEITLTTPTNPTKYMDYIFEKGKNGTWYLTALQVSETQPAATPTPEPTADPALLDTQSMVQENLDSTMTDAVSGEEPIPEETGESQPEAAEPPAE